MRFGGSKRPPYSSNVSARSRSAFKANSRRNAPPTPSRECTIADHPIDFARTVYDVDVQRVGVEAQLVLFEANALGLPHMQQRGQSVGRIRLQRGAHFGQTVGQAVERVQNVVAVGA